jgi:hypothetical protein
VKQRDYQNLLLKLGNGSTRELAVLSPLKCSFIQTVSAVLVEKRAYVLRKQSVLPVPSLRPAEHMRFLFKSRTESGADLLKKSEWKLFPTHDATAEVSTSLLRKFSR